MASCRPVEEPGSGGPVGRLLVFHLPGPARGHSGDTDDSQRAPPQRWPGPPGRAPTQATVWLWGRDPCSTGLCVRVGQACRAGGVSVHCPRPQAGPIRARRGAATPPLTSGSSFQPTMTVSQSGLPRTPSKPAWPAGAPRRTGSPPWEGEPPGAPRRSPCCHTDVP